MQQPTCKILFCYSLSFSFVRLDLPSKRESIHVEQPAISRRMCIRIELEFFNQARFHVCVLLFIIRYIPERGVTHV